MGGIGLVVGLAAPVRAGDHAERRPDGARRHPGQADSRAGRSMTRSPSPVRAIPVRRILEVGGRREFESGDRTRAGGFTHDGSPSIASHSRAAERLVTFSRSRLHDDRRAGGTHTGIAARIILQTVDTAALQGRCASGDPPPWKGSILKLWMSKQGDPDVEEAIQA